MIPLVLSMMSYLDLVVAVADGRDDEREPRQDDDDGDHHSDQDRQRCHELLSVSRFFFPGRFSRPNRKKGLRRDGKGEPSAGGGVVGGVRGQEHCIRIGQSNSHPAPKSTNEFFCTICRQMSRTHT